MLRIYSILNLLVLLILSIKAKFQQFSSFSANLMLKNDRPIRDYEPDNKYLDLFVA